MIAILEYAGSPCPLTPAGNGRYDNSLGKLTTRVINLIKHAEEGILDLNSGWYIRWMDSGSMHHFVAADRSCISWGQARYGELGYGPSSRTPLLLVGTNIGDIAVWEVGSRERLALRNIKVWDLIACSVALQASLANEYTASVNKVMWSPDGALFDVAYSKNIVHLHAYHGGDDTRNHLEINAHDGSVNDIAFCHLNKQFCVVTCGDDKLIKVWDAVTGSKHYSFEGHQLPICSM